MTIESGVYPCFENEFKVNTAAAGAAKNYVVIADTETFSVSIDNGVEEWHPFEQKGWVRRLMTAKSITITVNGKRNVGDPGNDHVAGLFMTTGQDAYADVQWTFPDGGVLEMEQCVINVTNMGAGDSTAVAPLEFEIMSNGKPTWTPSNRGKKPANDK